MEGSGSAPRIPQEERCTTGRVTSDLNVPLTFSDGRNLSSEEFTRQATATPLIAPETHVSSPSHQLFARMRLGNPPRVLEYIPSLCCFTRDQNDGRPSYRA